MSLTKNEFRTTRAASPGLCEQVIDWCEQARLLQDAGDFEGARAALSEVWQGVGAEPDIAGLDERAAAELLMRAGSIAGWVGDSRPVEGAQEYAKNLVTRALEIFDRLGDFERAVEARVEFGICYWHQGSLDEARVVFQQAYEMARGSGSAQEARALLHVGIMDMLSDRLEDAWEVMQRAEGLYGPDSRPAARGRFHSTRAIILRRSYESEGEAAYADRAFIEFTAAIICFEEAGHKRFIARTENNLGHLLFNLSRYDEAQHHLDRARRIFIELRDSTSVAQVNETSARVLIAQHRYEQAERLAYGTVHTLEKGDDRSLLAEALRTHGVALSRLNRPDEALAQLSRAAGLSETAGDLEGAGLAYLVILEELGPRLGVKEEAGLYLKAERLLDTAQRPGLDDRLRDAAAQILRSAAAGEGGAESPAFEALLTGGTFDDEVLRFESELIRRALFQSGRSVTRAARILGMSHQRLAQMLNERHSSLSSARAPAKRRLRSIITKPQPQKRHGSTVKK